MTTDIDIADEIVSIPEVATITGLTANAIRTYRKRGTLPEPIVVLGCGPIWRRSEIEEWAERRAATARGRRMSQPGPAYFEHPHP